MAYYLQIGADPTKWWLVQPFNANQVTGQPLTLEIAGPLGGTMVLSARAGSVAVFNVPDATVPADLNPSVAAVYLPTGTGASAHNFGYALLMNQQTLNVNVGAEIATAMHNGTRLTVPLYGGGTLVINGATVDFAVIQPGAIGDSSAHG